MQRTLLEKCFLAGWDHWDGDSVFDRMQIGDGLKLVREPNNEFDPNAIAVYYDDSKLGLIPRTSNGALALLLDIAKVTKVRCVVAALKKSENPWNRCAVTVSAEVDSNG